MLTSWLRTFSTVCRSARIEAFFVRTKSFRADSRRFLAAGIPRRFCLCSEVLRHIGRVAPQALQSVKATAVLGEDVKDEVSEIDQDPAPGRRAFDKQRFDAFVAPDLVHHSVGDRLRLPLGVRRTE